MAEVFLIGVGLGAALGVALTSLFHTNKDLNEAEAIERQFQKQDAIIKRQALRLREYEAREKGGSNNGRK
ncbi:MAG: hypothetical protein IK122_02605 [Alphaproteobacteria bacterium]|nr:hypothetical protein [Alphaproteobacteria bacterium]